MEQQDRQDYRVVFASLWKAIGRPVLIETPIQSTDLGAPTAPQTKLHTGILERVSGSTEGGSISVMVSGVEILLNPFSPGVVVSAIDRGDKPVFLFPNAGEDFTPFGR